VGGKRESRTRTSREEREGPANTFFFEGLGGKGRVKNKGSETTSREGSVGERSYGEKKKLRKKWGGGKKKKRESSKTSLSLALMNILCVRDLP